MTSRRQIGRLIYIYIYIYINTDRPRGRQIHHHLGIAYHKQDNREVIVTIKIMAILWQADVRQLNGHR